MDARVEDPAAKNSWWLFLIQLKRSRLVKEEILYFIE
jgi:hypothetical protein